MSHSPQPPRLSLPRLSLEAEIAALAGLAGDLRAVALHRLAARLGREGARTAAVTIYRQLCLTEPHDAWAHIGLANLLHEQGDAEAARLHYDAALALQPGTPEAHQGLGNLCAARGDMRAAWAHWRAGYSGRVFNAWAYRGTSAPVRVLLLISIVGGNVRARTLIDDAVCAVTAVHMEFFTPNHPVPPHDVVFNAIGDADLCGAALQAAIALVARTMAPVINPPASAARTGRLANARRLRAIPGVVCPLMAILPRVDVTPTALARLGFGWPVLLRAPGFHTGQHFLRADGPGEVADAVAALPGRIVLAMPYLEARGADGAWRKGRVMIIGGVVYPLHWAVSPTWKVHYFTAGMAETAAHRAEEARFLADMAGFLGAPAVAALEAIGRALGLDYAGVDFALDGAGRVMVFEANAAMVILSPPAGEMWDYRRDAAKAALDAARRLIAKKNCGEGALPPKPPVETEFDFINDGGLGAGTAPPGLSEPRLLNEPRPPAF